MSESNNSWLANKNSPIGNSLSNLSAYAQDLKTIWQRSQDYVLVLEQLLEGKTGPRREVLELTSKLREIKIEEARITEEIRQIEEFLKNSY